MHYYDLGKGSWEGKEARRRKRRKMDGLFSGDVRKKEGRKFYSMEFGTDSLERLLMKQ